MSLKIELLSLLSNDLLMIRRDYVGWSLTGKRICQISGLKSGQGPLRKLSDGRLRESSSNSI